MSLSPAEQFAELIHKSKRPIILLPEYPTKDAVASSVALSRFLTALGKETTVAGANLGERLAELPFLDTPEHTLESLSGTRDFVLSFDTTRNPILASRVEEVKGEYRIYITPKQGTIDPRDFSFIPARFQHDVAFVLGSPDRESLGILYEESPDIFYEMPVVNVDTRSENEHFGQLNLVDITASSVSEILFGMFSALDQGKIDECTAEALLAGIISATESFQKKNTTPRSLDTASKLITLGADREKVVLSLFKTQPFNILKLWGRVLTNLRLDEELRLVSARLSLDDFVQSRTKPEVLPAILDRIKANYSSGSLFAVVYPDTNDRSLAVLKAGSPEHAVRLAEHVPDATLHGDTIFFAIEAGGVQAESDFLEIVRKASGSYSS
jgi:nanoRNase/pAp phosphatase (c-di-AMP/oligoRNAs hydrolase)